MLQTLDKDGDPNNGIELDASTFTKLAEAVDLSQTKLSAQEVITQVAPTKTLVEADQARQHFNSTLESVKANEKNMAIDTNNLASVADLLTGYWVDAECKADPKHPGQSLIGVYKYAKAGKEKLKLVENKIRHYSDPDCSKDHLTKESKELEDIGFAITKAERNSDMGLTISASDGITISYVDGYQHVKHSDGEESLWIFPTD